MHFEVVGPITEIETIATGRGIRTLPKLRKRYGVGRWRKLKGIATVRLTSGRTRRAEVHWYEGPRSRTKGLEDQAIFRLKPDEEEIPSPFCALHPK